MLGSDPSQTEAPRSTTPTGGWDWLIYSQLITLNKAVGRVEGTLATVVDTQKRHDRTIEKLKATASRLPLLSFTSLKDNLLSLAALIYAALLLYYLATGQIELANKIVSSGASRLQISEGQ